MCRLECNLELLSKEVFTKPSNGIGNEVAPGVGHNTDSLNVSTAVDGFNYITYNEQFVEQPTTERNHHHT